MLDVDEFQNTTEGTGKSLSAGCPRSSVPFLPPAKTEQVHHWVEHAKRSATAHSPGFKKAEFNLAALGWWLRGAPRRPILRWGPRFTLALLRARAMHSDWAAQLVQERQDELIRLYNVNTPLRVQELTEALRQTYGRPGAAIKGRDLSAELYAHGWVYWHLSRRPGWPVWDPAQAEKAVRWLLPRLDSAHRMLEIRRIAAAHGIRP